MSLLPPSPLLDETIAPGQLGHITDHEEIHHILNGLPWVGGSGTYAQMQAVVSPRLGDRWVSTDQLGAEFVYNGTRWKLAALTDGQFSPLEYGADPTFTNDSRQAFIDCINAAAATTAVTGGATVFGEILVQRGRYIISSGIDLAADATITAGVVISMRGGSGGAIDSFLWRNAPYIRFTTGGFVTQTTVSHGLNMERMIVHSLSGVPLTASGALAPGLLKEVGLRAIANGYPALHIVNGFWGRFDDCVFQSAQTTQPSVQIDTNSTDPPALLGWAFRFRSCRFSTAGVRWDIGNTHGTVVGLGTAFEHCDTENFGSDVTGAFLTVRNTHATENTSMGSIGLTDCNHFDGGSDILVIETLGTGSLTVNGIRMRGCVPSSGNKHVRCVDTGGGAPIPKFLDIKDSGATSVTFAAATGAAGFMRITNLGGYEHRGYSLSDPRAGFSVGINGDAQLTGQWRSDGSIMRGPGGSTAPDVIHTVGTGSPEGVVTSNISGTFQRRDGAAGTTVYIKESGTGNTGWKPLWTGTSSLTVSAATTLTFSNTANIHFGSTSGTKIGTTTSDAFAFWNKTPIAQPTTAITAATRVGGGGTALTDTDTFGGYTIAKIAAALINVGLLA